MEQKKYDVQFDEERPAYTAVFTYGEKRYVADMGWAYALTSPLTWGAFDDEKSAESLANSATAEIMIFYADDNGLPLNEYDLYQARCSDVCEEEFVAHIDKFIQKLKDSEQKTAEPAQ